MKFHHQTIIILLSSLVLALLFWIADAVYDYFYFVENFRLMLFEEPLTFLDSLFFNIPPQSLFTRLAFVLACLAGGTISAWYLHLRKEAEEEKIKLEEQLRQAQKLEAVGRLAGGVAHDFNNMLSIINGYAELVLADLTPDSRHHARVREILKAGRQSAGLVRQLLAFARKQTVAPQVLDLNKTLEESMKMLGRLIGENIELEWNAGENLWKIKIDPAQVDQILANLAVNARDAIENVGKVTIETANVHIDQNYCNGHAECVPGDYVLWAVSDNGCGMEPEMLNRIFDPFFTTKEVEKGTGLGLSTVYGIVKQNNGFINVYSEPAKGTTFKIYLPRHHVKEEETLKREEAPVEPARGETILVVEDKPLVLKLCRDLIESMGYSVLCAETAEEALKTAREFPQDIHLLITDVIMPEMNGRELWEKIQPVRPGIKCLFMSGYTANVIAHHGILEKGIHFIEKPFTRTPLAKKIREVLSEEEKRVP